MLQVDIQLDADDYNQLRYEGRTFGNLFSGCAQNFTYTNFNARVVIDGQPLENVDVRKKGFLGSLSASRPSMKLNFATHVPGRRFESMQRMTLNNNRQDGSATHQCVTYKLFREAGLVAPRCNFARVSVNGQDLGYYSNIESIKEPFLQRNYGNSGGNLYEGQLGAFAEHRKRNLQLKTNVEINDRSDLDAVINALNANDANAPGLLEQLVDIDQFISFWAMEILTGHRDGATGNANNYFIYRNPDDQRFTYIPWGTDGALSPIASFIAGPFPIWHFSPVAARLYSLPEYRQKLFQRLETLLATVYDVDAIHAEMDRIERLTNSNPEAVAFTKQFAATQVQLINDAMAGNLEDSNNVLIDLPTECREGMSGRISGRFDGNRGSFEYTNPSGESFSLNGIVSREPPGGGTGISGFPNPPQETIVIFATKDGAPVIAFFTVEEPEFRAGTTRFHGTATSLFLIDTSPGGGFALVDGGTIEFTNIDEENGELSGTFEAELVFSDNFPAGANQ